MLNRVIGGYLIMLLQQSIEHVSIVYTCNIHFAMHWSMYFIQEYLVNVFIQNRATQDNIGFKEL